MFPPHFPNGCRGPIFFFPKDTLDCDKMKWSSGTSRSCDLAQTTKRGRHMTRPPAARPSVYHLSHAERWHLFILPGPRLRNQFHSNTRPACNANVQYAAPSGATLPHISDVVIPRRCLWGWFHLRMCCTDIWHFCSDMQMVWESGCVVIVMLTPLSENGVKQCHHYWPDEGSDVYHIYEVCEWKVKSCVFEI